MKMMTKKIKRGSALAAVCLLLFLAAVPRVARGAVAINTGKDDCSMTFSLGDNYEGELSSPEMTIPVKVYRIAGVTASGAYVPEAEYEGLGLEKVSSATTAEDWEAMAAEAAQIALPEEALFNAEVPKEALSEAEGLSGKLLVGKKPDSITDAVELQGGKGTIGSLETGMYLVVAFAADSPEYTYYFAPYLVSVPGNAYDGQQNMDDTWIYDVSVTLKPEQQNRLGTLLINKTINAYQPLNPADRTMFVFQVEVIKAGEGGAPDQVYYSNVVSLDFTAAGTQTLRIEGLPAGAVATVTEVYSGASYTIPAEEATVVSDPIVADGEVSVSFTNSYSGGLNGGTGVVNHFEHDGNIWDWTTQ